MYVCSYSKIYPVQSFYFEMKFDRLAVLELLLPARVHAPRVDAKGETM